MNQLISQKRDTINLINPYEDSNLFSPSRHTILRNKKRWKRFNLSRENKNRHIRNVANVAGVGTRNKTFRLDDKLSTILHSGPPLYSSSHYTFRARRLLQQPGLVYVDDSVIVLLY